MSPYYTHSTCLNTRIRFDLMTLFIASSLVFEVFNQLAVDASASPLVWTLLFALTMLYMAHRHFTFQLCEKYCVPCKLQKQQKLYVEVPDKQPSGAKIDERDARLERNVLLIRRLFFFVAIAYLAGNAITARVCGALHWIQAPFLSILLSRPHIVWIDSFKFQLLVTTICAVCMWSMWYYLVPIEQQIARMTTEPVLLLRELITLYLGMFFFILLKFNLKSDYQQSMYRYTESADILQQVSTAVDLKLWLVHKSPSSSESDTQLIVKWLGGSSRTHIKKVVEGKPLEAIRLVGIYTPDSTEAFIQAHYDVIRTGRPSRLTVREKEGTIRVVVLQPIFEDGKYPVGVLGTAMQVTELYESRESLARSEARLRAIFGSLGDYIMECEPSDELKITLANKGLFEPAGATTEGKSFLEQYFGENEQLRRQLLDRVNRIRNRTSSLECLEWCASSSGHDAMADCQVDVRRIIENQEATRFFLTRCTALQRSDGTVDAIILVTIDVTDQKVADVQQQIREQLEARAESIRVFLRNFSHELRNPLFSLRGSLQLLSESSQNLLPFQVEYVEDMTQSSLLIVDILNQVLEAQAVHQGEISLHEEPVNILDLIEQMARRFSSVLFSRGIETITWVDPQLPQLVVLDRVRVMQILQNLLTNACKFTNAGHIMIEAVLVEESQEGITVRLAVEDSGVGIRKCDQEKMLQPFVSLNDPKTRSIPNEFKGFGIGMSIVVKLCQLMGANMTIQSQHGKGSRFEITLTTKRRTGEQVPLIQEEIMPSSFTNALVFSPRNRFVDVIERKLRACGISHVRNFAHTLPCHIKETIIHELHQESTSSFVILIDDEYWQVDSSIEDELLPSADLRQRCRIIAFSFDPSKVNAAQDRQHGTNVFFLRKPVKQLQLMHLLRDSLQDAEEAALLSSPSQAAAKALSHSIPPVLQVENSRILVVEDNIVNQRLACRFLEKLGVDKQRIDTANDGKQGLDKFIQSTKGNQQYGLILMDLNMPVMDGMESCRHIREIDATVPIVACTANAERGVLEECKKTGFSYVVFKPYVIEELEKAIQSVVTPVDDVERSSES